MPEITYCAVSDVDFDAFTQSFNQAYSDYYVPIVMTPGSFRSLMARDNLEMDASVVALDGEAIVGTGLLGIRDHNGWIGGMGVIPAYRRQGIARRMMHYLLDRAREHQIDSVKLEVIEANEGAYSLYQQIGFADLGYLLILGRSPEPVPDLPGAYRVEERSPELMLPHYAAFHSKPNCWQRDLPSLLGLIPYFHGWAALSGEQVIAYAVGWSTEHEIRLIDLAADPTADPILAAQSLLAYFHHQNPEAYGNAYNIGDDDPLLAAYQAFGYVTSFRQIEMAYKLPQP